MLVGWGGGGGGRVVIEDEGSALIDSEMLGEEGVLRRVICLRGSGGRGREGVRGRWGFAGLSMWLDVGHISLLVDFLLET